MADPADVVPLRRGGYVPFHEPTAVFADVSDPARTLSLAWSPDQQSLQLGVETPEGTSAVVLRAGDLLELVQAVMDGLPRPSADSSPVAAVLPLRPRESHSFTQDS